MGYIARLKKKQEQEKKYRGKYIFMICPQSCDFCLYVKGTKCRKKSEEIKTHGTSCKGFVGGRFMY